MERFCITLAQAKRLIELGFKRGTEHWWIEIQASKGIATYFDYVPMTYDHLPQTLYPAYHVGELGEILNSMISEDEWPKWYEQTREWVHYEFFKDYSEEGIGDREVCSSTEAQARGALLIYLLENNVTFV